jgi:hypothetical protein
MAAGTDPWKNRRPPENNVKNSFRKRKNPIGTKEFFSFSAGLGRVHPEASREEAPFETNPSFTVRGPVLKIPGIISLLF